MERLLYTTDPSLRVEGFQKVEELPEELEKAFVLVDIDTVGLSSLPDLKDGENIPVALTSKSIPGYTIKLVSLGFYDVLLKPIDEERLRRLLQKLDSSQKVQRIIYLHKREEEVSGELCKESVP